MIDEKALAHAFYKFDTCIHPGEVYSVNAHKYGRAIEKTIIAYLTALEAKGYVIEQGWIETSERLPEKPGIERYEHVRCLIMVRGCIEIGMWNCEHLVWDDDEGDDFRYNPKEPTHWRPLPEPPSTLSASDGEPGGKG